MQRIVNNTSICNQSQWWSPLPKQFSRTVIRWSGEAGVHGGDKGQKAMKAQSEAQSTSDEEDTPREGGLVCGVRP